MWMNVEIWSTTITFNIATLTLKEKGKNKPAKDNKGLVTCWTRPEVEL